jgi:hypothetical protein
VLFLYTRFSTVDRLIFHMKRLAAWRARSVTSFPFPQNVLPVFMYYHNVLTVCVYYLNAFTGF